MNYQKVAPYLISSILFIASVSLLRPSEDAVILYEFSRTFSETGVISYGNAGYPIEGATDFLWMLIISFFSFFHVDEYLTALLLTFSALAIFLHIQRNYFATTLMALLTTPFIYSGALGFSSVFFSLIFVIAYACLEQKKFKLMFFSLLVLCLTRPDGVIWGAPLVLLYFHQERFNIDSIFNSLLLIIPGCIYFIWRYKYFNHFLPLPFYVKSDGIRDLFIFQKKSLTTVLSVYLPLLLIIKNNKKAQELALILLTPAIFYSVMTLSQNIGNRFIAPMFLIIIYNLKHVPNKKRILLLSLIFLSSFSKLKDVFNLMIEAKSEVVFDVSKKLSNFQGKMLTTEAGRLAYYSDWNTHDSWGLNTPMFTKRLVQPSDILLNKYDLIVSHCHLKPLTLDNNGEKTWDNMCLNISKGTQNKYDHYLVPFINPNSTEFLYKLQGLFIKNENCKRYDSYYIYKESPIHDKIESILRSYEGVRYSKELTLMDDKVCYALSTTDTK